MKNIFKFMGVLIVLSAFNYSCANEPVPRKPQSGKEGAIGDAVEKGVLLAGKVVSNGVDDALARVEQYEKQKRCPKRKASGLIAYASEDVARANTIADLKENEKAAFDDGSVWTVAQNSYLSPQQRMFQMRTVTYKKPTEIGGFPLWNARIQERWRQGCNNKNQVSTGLKTTFRKLDREITPYGYVAIAGITLVALKALFKILS